MAVSRLCPPPLPAGVHDSGINVLLTQNCSAVAQGPKDFLYIRINNMATIDISVDEAIEASVFDAVGDITADDIIAAMDRQYVDGTPPNALWDYARADFNRLETSDYRRIAMAAKERAIHRIGGKTAFVTEGALELFAVKLLEANSKVIDLPLNTRFFETHDEAVAWLREDEL